MNQMKDRITTIQVALLMYTTLVGVGYLSMPRLLAETAGRDGWISLILGGLLVMLAMVLLAWLGQKHPGQTIIQYSQAILGRPLGQAVNILLLLNFVLMAGASSRLFGEVLKVYLLEHTPLEVILISFFLTGAYLSGHGLNPLARLSEAMFPLLLIPIFLILGLAQMEIDYSEVLPLLAEGVLPVLTGVSHSFQVYAGFIILAFLAAFMQQPKKALKASAIGIAGVIITYIMIFVVTLGSLGVTTLNWSLYPVVDLARRVEVPGAFVEKLEAPLLALWVLTAFTTMAPSLYFGTLSLAQILGLKEHRGLVFLFIPVIYQVAMLPRNFGETVLIGSIAGYAALGTLLLAVVLALVTLLRKGGGKNAKEETDERANGKK
jgi:spore germination protein